MVFSGKGGGFSRRQYRIKEGLVPITREGGGEGNINNTERALWKDHAGKFLL